MSVHDSEARSASAQSERVIIVGGGIIGIACAHYLDEAGYQVTVIDKGEVGQGCSHANCGLICPSDVLPLTEPGAVLEGIKSLFNPKAAFRIKPQLRLSLYRWMLQFARRCNHSQMIWAGRQLQSLFDSSVCEYQRLFQRHQFDAQLNENGLLYVLESEQGLRKFKHTEATLSDTYGIVAKQLPGDELGAFDPAFKAGLAGGFLYEKDSSLRPDQLIRSWHEHLVGRGVTFSEFCELESVQKEAGSVRSLKTSQGELSADHYVFATGAWSRKLATVLDCNIPVEPGKGYSITMSKPELCPKYPALFPEHNIGITPFDDSYRIASMMEFAGYDSTIPPQRIELLKSSARPYLKSPVGEETLQTWYGWRPMTWDGLPIIGRVPNINNSFLATGHNMLGLSLAPVTGRLITDLIQERTPHVSVDAFSPNRF